VSGAVCAKRRPLGERAIERNLVRVGRLRWRVPAPRTCCMPVSTSALTGCPVPGRRFEAARCRRRGGMSVKAESNQRPALRAKIRRLCEVAV
jgi:hypothetical protein